MDKLEYLHICGKLFIINAIQVVGGMESSLTYVLLWQAACTSTLAVWEIDVRREETHMVH